MALELKPIPPFTQDDFLNTTAPYEFLYEYHTNKFLMGQMREQLKTYAARVGVKGFVSLWNGYLESVQKQTVSNMENATCFDGQEIELMSGEYCCSDTGVTIPDKFGNETTVCPHPILPVKRFVNIDTGEERLMIAYKKGYQWRHVIVEKSVIASSASILQLSAKGIVVNSENAKDLSTYLLTIEQLNYNEIPEEQSVSHLGWIGNDGFAPYLDGLVFDGEQNFKRIFSAVAQKGDFNAWIKAMKAIRQRKGAGRFFLAASFASVIIDPCGLLPFFLHAYGETEVGKSVGLMVAASVWADPRIGEYITTFNSTLVGQEMTAIFLNNLPMCIDELQIQESLGVKDFDKMIYHLCEGVGKTRGAKAGGLQAVGRWRNCFITTGERPISNPSSKGGAINRIIEVEVTQKIASDLPALCNVLVQNYGHAGKMFVEALMEPGAMDYVRETQKRFYRELLANDATDKQAAAASAILAADSFATLKIFRDENYLTAEDFASLMAKKEDINIQLRALELLRELPTRYPKRFDTNDFKDYSGECWGKTDESYLYIINSVFNELMQKEGYNAATFLKWAKRAGMIDCTGDKSTKVVRIGEKTVRCVVLRLEDPKPEIKGQTEMPWPAGDL